MPRGTRDTSVSRVTLSRHASPLRILEFISRNLGGRFWLPESVCLKLRQFRTGAGSGGIWQSGCFLGELEPSFLFEFVIAAIADHGFDL
jgi:hypothetical protein